MNWWIKAAKAVVESFSLVKEAHGHPNQKMSKMQRTHISYLTHFHLDADRSSDLDFSSAVADTDVDYKHVCLPQPMSL